MRPLLRFAPLFLLLILPSLLSATDGGDRYHAERSLFLNAWERLAAGRPVNVAEVQARLGDYPLAPYLEWQDLRHRISQAQGWEIRRFTERHPTLPVTSLLQRQWLNHLGRERRWSEFLDHWDGQGGTMMDCYRLRALRMERGVDDDWIREARSLWTVGHSQPNACDPVFDVLYDRDLLDRETRWERIRLIMARGDTGLARALRGRLRDADRPWLDHWLSVAANPATRLRNPEFDTSDHRGREIVEKGIRQLAVNNRDTARILLDRYRNNGTLDGSVAADLQRVIALRAAWSRDAEALEWLEELPAEVVDAQVLEWTARVALGREHWERLLSAIGRLPGSLADSAEWRYWKAEALERTGQQAEAESLYREVAEERSYYGFLAADRMGLPYTMNHNGTPADDNRRQNLLELVELRRAGEFRALTLHTEARREWLAALARMEPDDKAQAASLALDWGWYDRAVQTANSAGLHNDLRLRFPLAWLDQFTESSEREGLDLALVYAISRKESAFIADAHSPAGALGLMQVMPGTARQTARELGLPEPRNSDLLNPDTNLRIGTAYLREMLERFDGNLILAAAAYNAGPNRVDRWRDANAGQPAAVWIENITYGETRDYVKSILAFRAVYDWQLNGEPRRLSEAMPRMAGPGEG